MSAARAALLAIFAALIYLFLSGQTATVASQQPEVKGLFGTISNLSRDHPRAVAGETDITFDTTSGPVELTATTATIVRIPGLESASVENLSPGDSVAVLSSGGQAVNILVRTTLPERTRHFTGLVISVDEEGIITLQSPQGDHITALALDDPQGLQPGELVTAVVQQDPPTGGLVITSLDRALDSLARITSALELAERAKASGTLEALRQRLISNSTSHLTAVREASQKADRSSRGRVRQELETVTGAYADALYRSNAGQPRAEVTGIISSIDLQQQRVTILPKGLQEVEVAITSDTLLWRSPAGLPPGVAENWLKSGTETRFYVSEFGGRETRLEQLDIASRVRVWYELDTNSSTRVLVLPGESLGRSSADALLSLAQRGEAAGVITAVDLDAEPPTVSINDEVSGTVLNLTVSPDSTLRDGAVSVGIASLPGTLVTANFDPGSFSIIELNTLTLDQSEATVFGVVHSFISKVVPSNFFILTPEGELRAFSHTDDTVIRRDGRPATIGRVRLGDLVRPGTRYRTANEEGGTVLGSGQELVFLSLNSPQSAPVQGTIRGIAAAQDGGTLITLSNNWLELVSLLVTDDTVLTREGKPMALVNLKVGQRIITGSYDPISTDAVSLVVGPPRALPIKGEITAVDETESAITITPRRGDPVRLFVPASYPAPIKLRGTIDPQFSDLQPGQQVRIGFYDPKSMEALKLVVN